MIGTATVEAIRFAGHTQKIEPDAPTNPIAAITPNPTPINQTMNQTMNHSPGGMQAGGDITINQKVPPRKLTSEQEAQFVRFLKDNPKGSVYISCIESGGQNPVILRDS